VTDCPRCAELTRLLTAERERGHALGNEVMQLRERLAEAEARPEAAR
jgi:hypothetical protein